MNSRKSSPSIPISTLPGLAQGARRTGSRVASAERARLSGPGGEVTGWTLNVSRGGARLVVEQAVEVGASYQLAVDDQVDARTVRVVWVQDEADGQIVGVQFLDAVGSIPAPPPRPQETGGSGE